MPTCFVIQPFDRAKYDKRFDDIFAPAIEAAGLEPYRVDKDPGVNIPIDDIERGIRDAAVCFAEISTDNPNVWFELGYAIAARKSVVLICSDERKTDFPFDVRHRNIITYATESPRDFQKLAADITTRLKAVLAKDAELMTFATVSTPLKPTEGLAEHEIVALAVIMQNRFAPGGGVTPFDFRQDMVKAGYNELAANLALEALDRKRMVQVQETADDEGQPYVNYFITQLGVDWLMNNQDKLSLRKAPSEGDVLF